MNKTVRTAWMAAAGGSAGVLAHLAAASKSTVIAVFLVIFVITLPIAISLPKIVESIYKRRPEIVREKSIARVLRSDAATRRRLALAGLDPEKTEQAERMLRLHAITPALPKDQRLSDDAYRELLKPDRSRSSSRKPPAIKGGGVLLPFQQPSNEGCSPND